MPDRLHITNGDSAAEVLKHSGVGGDVLPWRDPMHYGPFPDGLDLDAVSVVRAQFLSDEYPSITDVGRDFRIRNDRLRAASGAMEIVLWFEHDLLDQLQILQLLDWFADADPPPGALSLICIDRFDGVAPFCGIGQLGGAQVASLFPHRRPVSRDQMRLAKTAWSAFRSPDPTAIETLLAGGTDCLPFLHAALRRYLEEFPSVSDGLTRTERQILTLVANGVAGPGAIFVENMNLESALFIGDWATFRHIARLCRAEHPLLRCGHDGPFLHPPQDDISRDAFLAQRLSLTRAGDALIAGARAETAAIERDAWLGGVHLRTGQPPRQPIWMWDATAGALRLTSPNHDPA